MFGLNKVLLDKTHLELAATDLDGSSTKDKIVKTLLGVWTAGRFDEAQPTAKWEKTIWKMPCVKLGKHVLELGAEHVKITKTEGILGAYLGKELLQQTETFIIKTSDIKWIHLSTASRVPLSQWFVTTAIIASAVAIVVVLIALVIACFIVRRAQRNAEGYLTHNTLLGLNPLDSLTFLCNLYGKHKYVRLDWVTEPNREAR